jgi:transcriptional regulator with PAS, ATPase and Fis domain
VEQLALNSPLPMIRKEDVYRTIPSPNSRTLQFELTQLNVSTEELNKGLNHLMAEHEAQIIRLALQSTADVDKAAQTLGISRSSLYKKIKDHSIEMLTRS